MPLPEAQIRDEAELADLLDVARPILLPDLAQARVDLELLEGVEFLRAFVDLGTLDADPLDRLYIVQVDPRLFEDPPSNDALRAVLAHELGHVHDYVGMDEDALVEFALWYAAGDVAAYERQTDEQALDRGCADGLAAYRRWVYAHVDEETEAEKREDYYTPREIAAWEGCAP